MMKTMIEARGVGCLPCPQYAKYQVPSQEALPETHKYLETHVECFSFEDLVDGDSVSLRQKELLLGWPLERITKTVYFQQKETGTLYGALVSGRHRVDKAALQRMCDSKSLVLAKHFPQGMRPGSCGPFLSAHEDIGCIVIDEMLLETRSPVDFAVPGAPWISMHISPVEMKNVLDMRKIPYMVGKIRDGTVLQDEGTCWMGYERTRVAECTIDETKLLRYGTQIGECIGEEGI